MVMVMKFKHTAFLSLIATLFCFGLVLVGSLIPKSQRQPEHTPRVLAAETASSTYLPSKRIQTTGCSAHDALLDSLCTPGAVFPLVTVREICVAGYSSTVRNVPESVKAQVFAEYGITTHVAGEYEVDHLISLELGGSNDIANLWPELANPSPRFHQKDIVKN